MVDHVVDSCSLLNLCIGWRGLEELRGLRAHWCICERVVEEAEYTREFGADGTPLLVPLDMHALIAHGPLALVRPETEAEMEDYVSFASEVDDGEAQALAIAKRRGFVLLTDDQKALKIAARADVAIQTTTTPAVLRAWADLDRRNNARLPAVIQRITILARFVPPRNSPDSSWWHQLLSAA